MGTRGVICLVAGWAACATSRQSVLSLFWAAKRPSTAAQGCLGGSGLPLSAGGLTPPSGVLICLISCLPDCLHMSRGGLRKVQEQEMKQQEAAAPHTTPAVARCAIHRLTLPLRPALPATSGCAACCGAAWQTTA